MSEPLISDYLDKLILLESKVGAELGYQLFEPPATFEPSDSLALNKAAREIATFVGMKEVVTVAATTHPKDCAGHIDLSDTTDGVFIEIASDLLDYPRCVLATLAHEISHRFLHRHNISCGHGLEFHYHNEILTDITAIFLGLGKLMVNGNKGEKIVKTSNKVVTQTKTVGYLELNQVIFVYLFVCAMRGVAPSEYERGILPAVVTSIREGHGKYYGLCLSADFHRDQSRDVLEEKCERTKTEGSNRLNTLEARLRELEQGYLSRTSDLLNRARGDMAALRLSNWPTSYDPALRFLLAVRANVELTEAIEHLGNCFVEAEQQTRLLSDLLAVAQGTAKVRAKRSWRDSFSLRKKPHDQG